MKGGSVKKFRKGAVSCTNMSDIRGLGLQACED